MKTTRRKAKNLVLGVAVVMGLLLFSSLASADSFILDNTSSGPTPGPYGTVMVTQDGTNAVDINITLSSPYVWITSGFPQGVGDGLFALNTDLNASSLSFTQLSGPAPGDLSLIVGTPTLHFDGYGYFDLGVASGSITASNSFNGTIGFKLSYGSAITPSDFEFASTNGGLASFFAADISGNGKTGLVGTSCSTVGGCSSVPEPSSLLLLGLGLLGFVGIRLKCEA